MSKPRILLKLSGASLSNNKNEPITSAIVIDLIDQIIKLQAIYSIGIVIGGGNIWRGSKNNTVGIVEHAAHNLGMIATLFNAFLFQNLFTKKDIQAKIYSPLSFQGITHDINATAMNKDLDEDNILIFACGTGMPFVSTDTAAAIRAIEIGAKTILMAKDGVDGVYLSDPKEDSNAIFCAKLSYDEIIQKKLKVIDLTSLILCQENKLTIKIFNQHRKNSLVDIFSKKIPFTLIN